MEENIITRFGCPQNINTNNAQSFPSNKMKYFWESLNIKLGYSTTHYPQGNGLDESSNKI